MFHERRRNTKLKRHECEWMTAFHFLGWNCSFTNCRLSFSVNQWSTVPCTCTASTFWSSYLNGGLWGSVLRVLLNWRKITCADRRDATRIMKLAVATRVSKGGDAETLSADTFTPWCTAQIIQFSSSVSLSQCLLTRWRQTVIWKQKTLPRSVSSPSACRASSVRMGETTWLIHW